MRIPNGTRLGPYEIETPLGAGGMGEVYRALDRRLDRSVAVKTPTAGLAADAEALAMIAAAAEGSVRDGLSILDQAIAHADMGGQGRVTAEQVRDVVRLCVEHGAPVVARGAGTGLSGGANAVEGGVVLSLERMDAVLEVNTLERYAVVQPGVESLG